MTIKIDHSIKTDPEIGDSYTLQFDHLDGHGANAQICIEDFGFSANGMAIFRQSCYDTGRVHILKGDIARISVTEKNPQYIKRYSGKNKCLYLVVYFKVIEIIVRDDKVREQEKEFDRLYNEFFRPLRRKMKIINSYIDYRPLTFAKLSLCEDYILGNVDKLDLEIIFRKELQG